MQPLAVDDVAAALADIAVGPPANATLELAGPEVQPIAAFVRRALAAGGYADGYRGPAGPLLRRGAGRPRPHPRRTQPAHRPDAVRGLAQSLQRRVMSFEAPAH